MSDKPKYRGLGDDRAPPTPKLTECVEDGYSSICPKCAERWGPPLRGTRALTMTECPGCLSKKERASKTNFGKAMEEKFLRGVVDAPLPVPAQSRQIHKQMPLRRDAKDRPIYTNIEHLL